MAEREDAVEAAVRALRFRDRSSSELDAWLVERGVGGDEREHALEALVRMGYVDDERFARTRARELAGRASGNALIRHDLERRGIGAEQVEAVLGELEPERERAARVAAKRGPGPKTARYLASRGFGEDALQAAVAQGD